MKVKIELPPELPKIPDEFDWRVVVCLPFDWGWSKNSMWVARGKGAARRLSPAARTRRDLLALTIRRELARQSVEPVANELWFGIHACLPDRRGDAINCLDLVADGIEAGTGIDDRWYQLAGLNWELQRAEPKLYVWAAQAAGIEPAKKLPRKDITRTPPEPVEGFDFKGRRSPPWLAQ